MKILFALFRVFLSLRYRIDIRGLEHFDTEDAVLVFPNHPALVDPLILLSYIGKKKLLSPVMTETFFHTPGLGPIIRALKTIPVGDIARGGSTEDVKKAFSSIKDAMSRHQDIIIYPSGHIYVQPFEHIVGKKMAHEMISMIEGENRIILVRTRGLWGSMWGKAYTGKSPVLSKILIRSIWYILANGIFFLPKRSVSVECVDMTEDVRYWATLGIDAFNQHLEEFYNAPGSETCQYIPHYFYHNDVRGKKEPTSIDGSIAELASSRVFASEGIDPTIIDQVISKVAEIKQIPKESITPHMNLILDLHADSLDMAECKSAIQALFPQASNPPITLIKTVGDLILLALGRLQGEEILPVVDFAQSMDENIVCSFGQEDTILTCLKRNFRSEHTGPYIYDALSGMMDRDTFLLRSYVIGQYLRRSKNQRIGIMLPALSATSLLLVGTYLAGKLPVMLNWTVGEKSFAHCMNFAGLDMILTSRRFYQKISSPWLAQFEGKMVFIEDIIGNIRLQEKLIAWIKKHMFLLPKKQEEAVMLFTSGSESLPKAVVLTHQNILSDIDGALQLVPFKKYETLLGFLPPFHSFGFTINTIFPLIAPIQVVYTPDPNDARTIGKIISHTHASIVSATPTFLRMILANNDTNLLSSLRYAFVGAEKCSNEVFSLFHEKCSNGTILEGYGITECSPIVTVNPLAGQKVGSAGKIIPGLDVMIRSIDTNEVVSHLQQGMIYLSGPSIFAGYLDTTLDSPFEIFDEKKWYKTGDLGYIDEDGFLFITGRLKRFVKIAGEMISLPFIESILLEEYGDPESVTLAIEAKEIEGIAQIVLFSTQDLSLDEVNRYIHEHGASNLVKISRFEKLDVIPVLGTGKTDYKLLKSMII